LQGAKATMAQVEEAKREGEEAKLRGLRVEMEGQQYAAKLQEREEEYEAMMKTKEREYKQLASHMASLSEKFMQQVQKEGYIRWIYIRCFVHSLPLLHGSVTGKRINQAAGGNGGAAGGATQDCDCAAGGGDEEGTHRLTETGA
jgi:hypothetical protein